MSHPLFAALGRACLIGGVCVAPFIVVLALAGEPIFAMGCLLWAIVFVWMIERP